MLIKRYKKKDDSFYGAIGGAIIFGVIALKSCYII